MRANRFILIALAASAAMAAEPGRDAAGVRVGMVVRYAEGMSADLKAAFEREALAAMSGTGVNLVWREAGRDAGEESFDRVVVLQFQRGCSEMATMQSPGGRALGMTHISNGRVLPFVDLDCGRVGRMVEAADGEAFARALARVAAHEIHHALTGTAVHDEEGITKPLFTRRDLTARQFGFSAAAVDRLRTSLAPGSQQRGGGEQRAGAEE